MSFPVNPQDGDTTTVNNVTYVYSSALTAWVVAGSGTNTGNISGGNIIAVQDVSAGGNVSAVGNIIGDYFLGNGSQLTGINVSSNRIFNGNSEANIGTTGGNANISIDGVSNVAVFTSLGLDVTGNISASGNVSPGLFYGGGVEGLVTNAVTQSFNFGTITGGVDLVYQLGTDLAPGDAVDGVNLIDYTITSDKLANSLVLTSPNIGAATGTSLTVIGNVTAANINAAQLSVSGNILSNISTTGLITTTGNIVGGNIFATDQISTSGNITGGNLVVQMIESVVGNITGGNIISLGAVSAGSDGISTSGNVTGNNINGNLTGNVTATTISATGTISTAGNVFAQQVITSLLPQVLDDISNQCDGGKLVFPLTLNLANITSANITQSQSLQVAVSGNILAPWVDVQTWPWFSSFAGFPDRSPGYQVVASATSANIIFYSSPAQGSQVVLTIINNLSSTQLRKYPYSATTVALGD